MSALVEGRLERRREDVAVEHARVGMVEDGGLDLPPHQRLRLAHEELVEGVLARDEDGEPMASPPGASPLLPQARHGAREAHRKRAVEKPDVDPELERVRRRHAEEVALDEPTLDVSPLCRRVARAVGREAGGQLRPHALGGEPVDQLRRLPRLRETDRPQAALDEVGEELRAFPERAGAELELLVEERRVPEGDGPSCVRRGVLSDHRRLDAEQGLDELARVGDRGRREEELRLRSVDRRGAAKASQNVRDV